MRRIERKKETSREKVRDRPRKSEGYVAYQSLRVKECGFSFLPYLYDQVPTMCNGGWYILFQEEIKVNMAGGVGTL